MCWRLVSFILLLLLMFVITCHGNGFDGMLNPNYSNSTAFGAKLSTPDRDNSNLDKHPLLLPSGSINTVPIHYEEGNYRDIENDYLQHKLHHLG